MLARRSLRFMPPLLALALVAAACQGETLVDPGEAIEWFVSVDDPAGDTEGSAAPGAPVTEEDKLSADVTRVRVREASDGGTEIEVQVASSEWPTGPPILNLLGVLTLIDKVTIINFVIAISSGQIDRTSFTEMESGAERQGSARLTDDGRVLVQIDADRSEFLELDVRTDLSFPGGSLSDRVSGVTA